MIEDINNEVSKESACPKEVGAFVERMRREIANSKVTITLKYSSDRVQLNQAFEK